MDVLLERSSPQRSHRRCSLSLSSGRAGGRARFHRRLRLYLTPFPRASFSGHSQSFRERPRRLAFYRARSARTALDRRRQRVQQLRVRGDRATKTRDGRPGAARTIDEHDLGEPAARRSASTKPREDANARRCRVTCRTRRRRGAAIWARKRKIAPSKLNQIWQLAEFLLRMEYDRKI